MSNLGIMLQKIHEVLEAISNSYGDDYFNKITLSLNSIIAVDYTFIARINEQNYSSQTIALVANGVVKNNIEYSLKDTPCANVTQNSTCIYLKNICSLFPDDQLLIDMDIQGYIGTPLIDSKHKIIGLLVALHKKPIENEDEILTLFELFSARIAAELERLDYENSLEDKINERSHALTETIKELKENQKKLIESEKMASLGNLVAGITHEVNTPLGIAITTHSILIDELKTLNNKIDNEQLTRTDMDHYRQASSEALVMQGENLIRAKKLIENFKKTAVDQHQLEIETINIKQYYQQVTSTLRSILKPKKAILTIDCPDNIIMATYPGVHAQILTNLISNSIRHGFSSESSSNTIKIKIHQNGDGEVIVQYSDNGKGLSEEAQTRVFEPFYTTAREVGGIGLGMSIITQLITEKLNGTITLESSHSGACFIYKFKASNL